jgi:hypothetical protein
MADSPQLSRRRPVGPERPRPVRRCELDGFTAVGMAQVDLIDRAAVSGRVPFPARHLPAPSLRLRDRQDPGHRDLRFLAGRPLAYSLASAAPMVMKFRNRGDHRASGPASATDTDPS